MDLQPCTGKAVSPALSTDGNINSESVLRNLQLQSLLEGYHLSNDEGYPVLSLSLPDGSQWSKLIWTRTSIPPCLYRWNTPEEVLSYLISFDQHHSWLTKHVPKRPPSGTIRLYDKTKTKNFRDDGYDWKTRSSSIKSVREDRMKLKVLGQQLLCAAYAHSESNPFLHRRCYWFTQNPDIVLVHYLVTDAKSHKKTVLKKSQENGFEVTLEGTAPADYALLAISDDNICIYLARGHDGEQPKPLLRSLSRFVWIAASLNKEECLGTLIKELNKRLHANITPEVQSESQLTLPNNVPLLLITQAIELLKLQAYSSQYGGSGLIPKGAGCLPPSVLLQAASQIINSWVPPSHPSPATPLSLACMTPETQRNVPPPQPVTRNSIMTQQQRQPAESDAFGPIEPPSLDCIRSFLPEPLESDTTGPSHSGSSSHSSTLLSVSGHPNDFNMEDFSRFAQNLRTMNPLKDLQQLRSLDKIHPSDTNVTPESEHHQRCTTTEDLTHLINGTTPVPSPNETSGFQHENMEPQHGSMVSQNGSSITPQHENTASQNGSMVSQHGIMPSQKESTTSQHVSMSSQHGSMVSQDRNFSVQDGNSVPNGIEWETVSLFPPDQISDLMIMDFDPSVDSHHPPVNSISYNGHETSSPAEAFLNQFFNEVSSIPSVPFNPDSLLQTPPTSASSPPWQSPSSNPCTSTDNTALLLNTPDHPDLSQQLEIDNETLTQLLASRSCVEEGPPSPATQYMDSLVPSDDSFTLHDQTDHTFNHSGNHVTTREAWLEPRHFANGTLPSPSSADAHAQMQRVSNSFSHPVPEHNEISYTDDDDGGAESSTRQNGAIQQPPIHYYQNGMESNENGSQNGIQNRTEPLPTTTFQLNIQQDNGTSVHFVNSLLHHPGATSPGHASSSVPHSELPIPTTFPSTLSLGYRASSPLPSPSSPSLASVSSLSTAGGESYLDQTDLPSVAELCEILGESPVVQNSDFSHLSLSDSDQHELLKASRVIQNTMRRCKDHDHHGREKDAVLCIERSYKRYRELKLMKDAAARRIQFQYRLYRQRTQELHRATLFIQQMYRYQRHKHHHTGQKSTQQTNHFRSSR